MRYFAFVFFLFFSSCGLYENEKNDKSEIIILSERINANPTDTDLLLLRVKYNKDRNNLESALFDLNQCIQIDSLNNNFHFSIAEIYFELSKKVNADREFPSLAVFHLEKALKIDINDDKSNALLGELFLAYGRYKDAIKHFNISLNIKYNQAKTHMLMGYAFKQLEQLDKAIDCFRNALNVEPDFKEAFIQLGQIFHLRGDTDAIIYYNNALRLDSIDEITLYNKALFFQSILDWNRALEAYSDLHKVNAFHSNGHYNIGFIHMELGLYDIAVNNFSDAIYGNSEFYEAYYSRGNCFETLGNIAQAEVDYTRAVQIKSDYSFAVEALKELKFKNKEYIK